MLNEVVHIALLRLGAICPLTSCYLSVICAFGVVRICLDRSVGGAERMGRAKIRERGRSRD